MRLEFGTSGIAWREIGTRRTLLARNPKEPGMVATRTIFENSLKAFRQGTAPPVSATDARDVMEVIAACYHSAATHQRVDLRDSDREWTQLRMGAVPT